MAKKWPGGQNIFREQKGSQNGQIFSSWLLFISFFWVEMKHLVNFEPILLKNISRFPLKKDSRVKCQTFSLYTFIFSQCRLIDEVNWLCDFDTNKNNIFLLLKLFNYHISVSVSVSVCFRCSNQYWYMNNVFSCACGGTYNWRRALNVSTVGEATIWGSSWFHSFIVFMKKEFL